MRGFSWLKPVFLWGFSQRHSVPVHPSYTAWDSVMGAARILAGLVGHVARAVATAGHAIAVDGDSQCTDWS